jgi:predicted nucleic acid-binding protein
VILLDTNVVSEPLRPAPDRSVIEWIDAQPLETLFLSSITVAELRSGVALLPAGKRRAALLQSLETQVLRLFAGRVLPFDPGCTQAYADLLAKARASGLAIARAGGYIASIAVANGMAVATRDTGPFEAAGVVVINPWQPRLPIDDARRGLADVEAGHTYAADAALAQVQRRRASATPGKAAQKRG